MQEFVGFAGAAPARQSCFAAAKMSLKKAKAQHPGPAAQRNEGPHHNVVPRSNGENAHDCLKIV